MGHNQIVARLAVLVLVAAAVAGCSKPQAKTPPAPPPLVTPAPPDRVIIPATAPEPAPEPSAAPSPSAPSRPRETPAARPERPPPAAAPPQAAAPSPEPPPAPPVLQTTTNPAEVEQRARSAMSAAKGDLDRINPAQLTPNARAQYNTARDFLRQADNALKIKNVVLARELADKAAALANQLRR